MHQYLKAIGFGNISNKKELNKILTQVKNSFTQHNLIGQDEETDFCEYEKEYGPLCNYNESKKYVWNIQSFPWEE